MKKIILLSIALLGITSSYGQENDYPEFTGENFSLEGALSIFKKSKSIEEFEKLINEESNDVNNLDLNDDGEIDYVVVEDIKENDTHVIVMSTYLNETEKQDIATIGIEKTGNEEAVLQIEGDSGLYATNTFAEPFNKTEVIDKTKGGPAMPEIITNTVIVNVWLWPCVRYIYAPRYVVWVSPHRWGYYPRWWKPWRVRAHHIFYKRCTQHRVYYHRTPTHRVVIARKVYTPKRRHTTLIVKRKHSTTVIHKNGRGKTKAVRIKNNRKQNRRKYSR
jgi:hypothetical protein